MVAIMKGFFGGWLVMLMDVERFSEKASVMTVAPKIIAVCSSVCYKRILWKIKCVGDLIDVGQSEKIYFEEVLATLTSLKTHAWLLHYEQNSKARRVYALMTIANVNDCTTTYVSGDNESYCPVLEGAKFPSIDDTSSHNKHIQA